MTWSGLPKRTYRPIPADFPERYAEHGRKGLEDHYRAHKDTIGRWIIDHGAAALWEGRRAFLEEKYAAEGRRVPGARPGRSKRYVLGLTLGCRPALNVDADEE